jgi:flagellar M-ring protein FliF
VANAVEGLQVNHVSVVDNRGNLLSEAAEPDSLAGLTASQLNVRRQLEQYLAKKAETMLEAALGPGRALVRVAAEINFDSLTKTQEVYEPDGVLREDMTKEEKTDSMNATASVAAGAATNSGASTNSAAATPVNNTKNTSITKNKRYDIGKTTSSLMQQPGSIKRLSAAVFVGRRVEGTGQNRKEVPLTPKEREALTKIVSSALGIRENSAEDRQDEITLEEWSFNDQPAAELTQQMDKQQQYQVWWSVARSLFYPVLTLAVLLTFWRSFKKAPVETIPLGIPLGYLGNGPNGHGHGQGKGASAFEARGGQEPGVVTVEVLNQLIKENPVNVTQAVRSWLTRGNSGNH